MKERLLKYISAINIKKQKKTLMIFGILCSLLVLILPFIVTNAYILHIIISAGLYSVLALSLNLVTGFAGQLSFGHAAFYGIGAYSSALIMINLNVSFWFAILISAITASLFGFLLGLPTLRLRDDYLAIVTLGFGEIVRLVLINWQSLTRGPRGLPGIPAPTLFGYSFMGRIPYYYLVLLLLLFTLFIMRRIITSGIGLAMMSVKNDEVAAESIGIYPIKYKLMAFMISAAFAGIAGAFYASYISFISPDTFIYNDSVTILAMVVLGGLSSIPGSIIGAIVLTIIPELLRAASEYRMIFYGLLMVIMMIFRPQGFWGINKRQRNMYKILARGGKNEKYSSIR